mmetsp:Transcript_9884/g.14568  ORF Transcript_9884/g.14568 Transcript_9884/m.14568 type:complete len:425 (-) Transcript_9884:92-1366(-)
MVKKEKNTEKEEEQKNDSPHESDAAAADDENSDKEEQEEAEALPLYKATRFKGYFILTLASTIHWKTSMDILKFAHTSGIPILQDTIGDEVEEFKEDPSSFELEETKGIELQNIETLTGQAETAVVQGMISMVLAALLVLIHLDSFTPLKTLWRNTVFKSKSKIEFLIILFFCIWWIVACIIETQATGIAGSEKVHYNLYFSVWICLLISIWTLERWCVASGLKSIKGHLSSWPNRSPGWIGILLFSSLSMIAISDVVARIGHIDEKAFQWGLLFSTIPFTIAPAIFFVLVELFRATRENHKHIKSSCETVFEGICLLVLVLMWIPTVIVATTPGGAADNVSNAYFFLWLTVLFLMDTAVWWIHDWRERVRLLILEEQKKYQKIQREIMKHTREVAEQEEEMNRAAQAGSRRDRFFSFDSITSR